MLVSLAQVVVTIKSSGRAPTCIGRSETGEAKACDRSSNFSVMVPHQAASTSLYAPSLNNVRRLSEIGFNQTAAR